MGAQTSRGRAMPEMGIDEKAVEVTFYINACKVDKDVENFDKVVQARTSRAMRAVVDGVQKNSLSLDCLKEVISSWPFSTPSLCPAIQILFHLQLCPMEDVWKTRQLYGRTTVVRAGERVFE
ncbi:hypothetical protein SUGI_0438130 [Cryptomeria japonica]|nr:hypothetical protein SUGI_0438130 [Cryptomeria japonica]